MSPFPANLTWPARYFGVHFFGLHADVDYPTRDELPTPLDAVQHLVLRQVLGGAGTYCGLSSADPPQSRRARRHASRGDARGVNLQVVRAHLFNEAVAQVRAGFPVPLHACALWRRQGRCLMCGLPETMGRPR